MSFLNKVYTCQGHENFDAWLLASGVPAERAAIIVKDKCTQKYEKNGDVYTFSESYPNAHKITKTFKSGEEFDDKSAENISTKTTFTVDGDTITQVIKTEKGTVTFKRLFSGDDLVVEITSDAYNGVAKRFYKA